jgi:hypothetical protein
MEESSLKNQSFGDSFKNLIQKTDASPGAGPEPDAGPGPGPDLGSGMDSASSQAGFKDFSSASVVEGSKDFLESNSWVAKIAFLLMVIIGFAVLFRLMVALITWLFSPGGKVVLVDGYINGSDSTIISQNPDIKKSITVVRSMNEKTGIEFTWSVWLYFNGFTSDTTYHHVFNKGNKEPKSDGIISPNNAPGLYINPKYDGIRVIVNSFNDPFSDTIDINDLPIAKWMNVVIRIQGKNCDVYVNGRLTRRRIMKDVVKQNYDDVNICLNGGFSGYLSNLTYYNNAISIAEIQDILVSGPKMKSASRTFDDSFNRPRYLADRWYFDQNDVAPLPVPVPVT